MRFLLTTVFAAIVGAGFIQGAEAQIPTFPSKVIRVVIPYVPGGAVDTIVRFIGPKMQETWGHPVISENRPGAGSNLGTEAVVRAAPDGHTLLATSSVIAVNTALYQKLSYDPVKDLAPVGLVVEAPNVLAVHPSLPARNVQELINLAKSKPGQIAYGSSGIGSPTHLGMELLKSTVNIDMLHVPYKGGGQSLPALMGGESQVAFITINAALPQGRAGKVRMIAVSSIKRVELAPDLPTIAESGVSGFDVTPWYALFVPAGTPADVVARLNGEMNRILRLQDVRERFLSTGMIPLGGSPDTLTETLKAEIAKSVKVIKLAGIPKE